jgi:hypothetical protein
VRAVAPDQPNRDPALERLDSLAGEWTIEALGGHGRTTFEWILGGQFLLQRSQVDHPAAPDGHSIIGPAPGEEAAYTQHYFDSRGVVRVYAMTFDGRVWTLERTAPDFTPLKFSQRFIGTVSEDGRRIDGAWESADPGGTEWKHDFDLNYARAA